ncbi:MAG: porin family protein [Gammaproteobacteria bacterium]|nr:porin family protein [Gammaproteobacteria bacterium]
MKSKLAIALGTALLWSTASQAEIFVGAGIGKSDIDDSAHAVSLDETDSAWKLYGGMMVTDNFGFEAGWADLGDASSGAVDTETEAFYAAGVAAFPIVETFSVYGKVGFAFWDQDINTVGYDGSDIMYGVGAKYIFADQFHARLEWEQFNADLETSMISVGLGLQF